MHPRSPFLIYENFLSPKLCEKIVDDLDFLSPDVDEEDNPIKTYKFSERNEQLIFERFQHIIPEIMKYYETDYRGTTQIIFEYLAEGSNVTEPICENSAYIRKKWTRTKDRDLTGIIFLSDYNEHPPFDTEFEVYGGNLEFPQHNLKFHGQRGTLILYPSGPHFINASSAVLAGNMYQARLHMCCKVPYLYDPKKFPGDYSSWFK